MCTKMYYELIETYNVPEYIRYEQFKICIGFSYYVRYLINVSFNI